MEEFLFWSLLGLGTSSVLTGWLIHASGLRRSGAHHGFAHGASDPTYQKPEMQDWMPIRPSEPGFWFKIGVILLVASSVISALAKLAKLAEAISNLVN